MIKVCLVDGFVVYEYASASEFVDAFPDGLDQSVSDLGTYIDCSHREAQEVLFEREDRTRRYNTRLPFVGQKCRD